MLVICVVFVPYMKSQNGKFMIFGCKRICVPYGFSIRRKHFAGNFSAHVVKTFAEASKVVDKPSKVIN